MFNSPHPASSKGAYASSRYVEAGCDGRESGAGRAQLLRTAKSCGPGLPVLRPSHDAFDEHHARRGQESRSPGRSRISRNAIAQGGPGCLGRTCGSCPVHFVRTGAMGAASSRPSLRPLVFSRGFDKAQLGRDRAARRNAYGHLPTDAADLNPTDFSVHACSEPSMQSSIGIIGLLMLFQHRSSQATTIGCELSNWSTGRHDRFPSWLICRFHSCQ
jgi:hypothetical protein